MTTSGDRRSRPQFTLIELLVVIAIIAIIASILLPALGQARWKSKQILTAGNMRQMIIGFTLYADANDGILPQGLADGATNRQQYPANLLMLRKVNYHLGAGLHGSLPPFGNLTIVSDGATWGTNPPPGLDLKVVARDFNFDPATEHPQLGTGTFNIGWPEGLDSWATPTAEVGSIYNNRSNPGANGATYMSWYYFPGYFAGNGNLKPGTDNSYSNQGNQSNPTGPVRINRGGGDYWMLSERILWRNYLVDPSQYALSRGTQTRGGTIHHWNPTVNPADGQFISPATDIPGTWAGGYDGHTEWKVMQRSLVQDQLYYHKYSGGNSSYAVYPRQPHTPADQWTTPP